MIEGSMESETKSHCTWEPRTLKSRKFTRTAEMLVVVDKNPIVVVGSDSYDQHKDPAKTPVSTTRMVRECNGCISSSVAQEFANG